MNYQIKLLIVLLGSWLISCNSEAPVRQGGGAVIAPVVEVPLRNITAYTTYPVSLEGTINSAVRAKVSGYITEVLVDEGALVTRGQPLFRLETQSLSEQAEAAQAAIRTAEIEVDKLKPLVEKEIVSEIQLRTAEAQLAQAKANYQEIKANIGYATINSPVSGRIGAIPFREGALVSPADQTPLTTVSKTEEVYAFFSMNEKEYLNLIQTTRGEDLEEKIKNLPGVQLVLVNDKIYEHTGQIETITGQVDASTGTVGFRAKFPNQEGILLSGNSGRIRIPKVYENVPVIPEAATFEQQGRVYVYRVSGDTLAVSHGIGVKDRVRNIIVVDDGLNEGDKIVAGGLAKIRDNTAIQPQPVSFDSLVNSLDVVFK